MSRIKIYNLRFTVFDLQLNSLAIFIYSLFSIFNFLSTCSRSFQLLITVCWLLFVFIFSKSTIGNIKSTKESNLPIPLLYELSFTHIFHFIIRSRYILFFEENYGWFAVLSNKLFPNFRRLMNSKYR